MKAKVNAKEFIQALDKVSGLIRKSVIPALEAVLVRFEDNRCTLTSTNLESWLSMEVFAIASWYSSSEMPRRCAIS